MNSQFHILCVDDDDTCDMLSATFADSAIKLTSANTVAEGWQLAQNEKFNLYLLATRFPDGNGFDLCRRIHNLAPHQPVVFYSGDAYRADTEKGLAAGAAAYIVKPFFDNIETVILNHIGRAKYSAQMKRNKPENTADFAEPADF